MVTRAWWIVAALVGTATSAHALKPARHADITKASCLAAGLPKDFCKRIATENYLTDAREWDDLRAHAQIDDGQTACLAADRTADRLRQLGLDLRTKLSSVAAGAHDDNVGDAASAVGRALHTIQDSCAHQGMPNPQHAWWSLSDFCDSTNLSPDTQDDAYDCAREQTDAVMAIVAKAVRDTNTARGLGARACPASPSSPHDNTHQQAVCDRRFLPGPIDGCRFLASAKHWDGIDRTWNGPIVESALVRAFSGGVAGELAASAICHGDERVLSAATSEPMVDVSAGPASCVRASVFCLGKVDADNPFDGEEDEPTAEGGCSTGGGGTGSLVVLLGLAALLARRRA